MVREERVPKGYKKTEVGVIPKEWEVRKLGEPELASIDSENLTAKTDPSYQFAYISLEDVEEGVLTGCTEMIFRNAPSRARRRIRKRDVLLSTVRPNLKSHFLVSTDHSDLVCSTGFSVIRCNEKQVLSSYMYYLLFYRIIERQIDVLLTGSSYPAINSKDVRTLLFPLPPLPEQKAIAEVLSDVDELIASIEKLIDKKQKMKQGTMQLLLTGRKRLPGFARGWEVERLGDTGHKKTEVGVIPEEWEVRRLGEVFIFLRTGTNSRSELTDEGSIGYIHYGDIHSKWDTVLDCSVAQIPYIEERKARNLPRLRDGDLVMVDASEDYAGLGKSVEIKNIGEQEIVAGLHTILLRGNEELVADGFKGFLQFMQPVRESLFSIATGISVYGISKRNLQDISVPLPPLPEQKAIAQILSDMDLEIDALEKKLDKYKLIKEGMMEELLTGKVRFV